MMVRKADFKTDSGFCAPSQRGRGGTVGTGMTMSAVTGHSFTELLAHLAADLVAALVENLGIRAREVDVFENGAPCGPSGVVLG